MTGQWRIWKYTIPVTDVVVIKVPEGARFLPFVASQAPGTLSLWAEVDPASGPEERRTVLVIGTGNSAGDVGRYIGSALDGAFVWHVYEGRDNSGDGSR